MLCAHARGYASGCFCQFRQQLPRALLSFNDVSVLRRYTALRWHHARREEGGFVHAVDIILIGRLPDISRCHAFRDPFRCPRFATRRPAMPPGFRAPDECPTGVVIADACRHDARLSEFAVYFHYAARHFGAI